MDYSITMPITVLYGIAIVVAFAAALAVVYLFPKGNRLWEGVFGLFAFGIVGGLIIRSDFPDSSSADVNAAIGVALMYAVFVWVFRTILPKVFANSKA